MQVEAELAVRSTGEPQEGQALLENYKLVRAAFKKMEFEYTIQKQEFDLRIEQLNDTINGLKEGDIMQDSRVQEMLRLKNQEIASYQKLMGEYKQNSAIVEDLSEKMLRQSEQHESIKRVLKDKEKLLEIFQEENQLLSEIDVEMSAVMAGK